MPKAYWIARIDVHDPETYRLYVEAARPAYERYNAKFLARGGRTELLEGEARGRNVIIEFDSVEDAIACYHSSEYARAKTFRQKASAADLIMIEGT